MFDKKSDPEERFNVANKPSYSQVSKKEEELTLTLH